MLFKISLSNIRKSIKDYAVYFFTLVLGVAVFYIFNAIETQTAFIRASEEQRELIKILITAISGVSVFIAIVLGLLIVYASRFLMKRRNREFALYMMLGMSKWRISAILLCETVIIGIGSLFVGLLLGVGFSQVMSAVVANLFEADMDDYRFTVSASAITKTMLYFGIMYLVVMLRSGFVISKCRLITLMNSGRRSEKITMKNPWLCVIVFLISAAALGWAYHTVGWDFEHISVRRIGLAILAGSIATFFIFWSVAGMLLRVIMSAKGVYHSGLNSFTFRQLSSKVSTTVASMTVICLMLFVTICTLSTAFTIRNSLNKGVEDNFPVDFYGRFSLHINDSSYRTGDIDDVYAQQNMSIYDDFGEYHHFHDYIENNFSFDTFAGDRKAELTDGSVSIYSMMGFEISFLKLSDYNAIMKLYGQKQIELGNGEYAVSANASGMPEIYDKLLEDCPEITVFGNTLKPGRKKCIISSFYPDMQASNTGTIIVPDNAVSEEYRGIDYFVGNYKASDKASREAAEKTARDNWNYVMHWFQSGTEYGSMQGYETKIEAANNAIGIGAVVTFLGLYIGFIFLVSCGAILALKELSESSDSIPRYTMLRKLGVEEKEISKSIFRQSGIFFLLPLLLACLHSYAGMRFAKIGLDLLVTENYIKPVIFTAVILIAIYGGYFLLTFLGSRAITREQKQV